MSLRLEFEVEVEVEVLGLRFKVIVECTPCTLLLQWSVLVLHRGHGVHRWGKGLVRGRVKCGAGLPGLVPRYLGTINNN